MEKRTQFGRVCILDFINFTNDETLTINNDLRISFEFFKSLDEVNNASTGKITIYGLTEETAFRLGNRVGLKYQSEVICKVGYNSDPNNIQPLFRGVVTNNRYRRQDGTSVTEIEVSASFQDFIIGQMQSLMFKDTSITDIVYKSLDYFGQFGGITTNDTPENVASVGLAIQSLKVKSWSFSGTFQELLERLQFDFGFSDVSKDVEGGWRFSISEKKKQDYIAAGKYLENKYTIDPNTGEAKQKDKSRQYLYTPPKYTGTSTIPQASKSLKNLFIEQNSKDAIILNFDTGLLERPYLDNKNVKVPYNSKIGKTDTVVEKQAAEAKRSKKTGEVLVDKETGKVKMKKPPKTMTINRRFMTIKALLNPAIKPQSQVGIYLKDQNLDGIYRVRNCSFKGDTHEGEWTVTAEIEDTANSNPAIDGKPVYGGEYEGTEEIDNQNEITQDTGD